jgi:glycosyltransferase involved in cell wall biosynthesis
VTWWRLSDLGLEGSEICRLAGIYDVTELATAVKPLFLRRLITSEAREIIYLDPDVWILGSLLDLVPLAREHGIVLTPHATQPYPDDDCRVDMHFILAAGAYNLGFVAVGEKARPFIDWWWSATRRHALHDVARMMFTDQRWIDLVPAFFDHHILKDEGYNVAYWNLHSREISCEDGRYLVNGRPLRFFHFSGFEPHKPHLLSRHQGDRPRVLLSQRPALGQLCAEYAARLAGAGYEHHRAAPYGWDVLRSGLRIDARMRRLYREALVSAERLGGAEPPSPFEGDGRCFVEWLHGPSPEGPPTVSRYLLSIYSDRGDLQAAFPDLTGERAAAFHAWVRTHGPREGIPLEMLPPAVGRTPTTPRAVRPVVSPGVQIAGYLTAELGVGEVARLMMSAVEFGGHPVSTFCYEDTVSRKGLPLAGRNAGSFDVNLMCVNADRIEQFVRHAGGSFVDGRYPVGYWLWELEHFPVSMHGGFDVVDEVWTPTDFVARSIRAAQRKPVYVVPPPLLPPSRRPGITRAHLGLPNRFCFLVMFDFLSILDRKNPLGAVEAFVRAFLPGEGPLLVLKSINGRHRLNDLERLRAAVNGRDDIVLVEDYYSVEEKNALLAECDCYVSLHRAEGLGLGMAEAMALGKPVIATGYSGNLHFMSSENSYLVEHALAEVPPGCEPYPAGAVWAEPDLARAAAIMQHVFRHPHDAHRKALAGRQDILSKHNLDMSARAVTERLGNIRGRRVKLSPQHTNQRPASLFRRLARMLASGMRRADLEAEVRALSQELRACQEEVRRLQLSIDVMREGRASRRPLKANATRHAGGSRSASPETYREAKR